MQLETNRLLLREPQIGDFDRYWSMVTDPVAKRFTGGVTQLTYDERRDFFLHDCQQAALAPLLEFSVVEKSSQRYIGYCGFRPSEEEGVAELIYGYCRDAWGQGFGKEAVQEILKYGFCYLRLKAVVATTHPLNVASAMILVSIGMQKTNSAAVKQDRSPGQPASDKQTDPVDSYDLSADSYLQNHPCP